MFICVPGLGTSTSKEAKEYFADMEKHRIMFRYAGTEDDAAITLVGLTCLPLSPFPCHGLLNTVSVNVQNKCLEKLENQF